MPPNSLPAIIFDMDGVLTDSEPRHFRALNVLLGELGHALSSEDYGNLTGQNGLLTFEWLRARYGLNIKFDEWRDRYDPIIVAILSEPATPLAGVRELIAEARSRQLPIAVGSTSRSSWVTAALGSLGLSDAFDAVVTGDMVTHGKPAPDIFLLAAENLGVHPRDCIVIEDSAPGVRAGKSAGMLTVQLRATATAAPPQPAADLVVNDLREMPLALLDDIKSWNSRESDCNDN